MPTDFDFEEYGHERNINIVQPIVNSMEKMVGNSELTIGLADVKCLTQ